MSNGPRLLVTGASGFLGAHIVNRARSVGLDVVAATRKAVNPGTVFCDVCDRASVDDAIRNSRPYVVIHCAAYGVNYADQDLDCALDVNVRGSVTALTSAKRHGVQRFVHIGSCFEYGSSAGPIAEDAGIGPTSVYGVSKAAATLLLQERARSLGMPLLIARTFGMWGPGEPSHRLIPQVIASCLDRQPLRLTPCEVVRDLTYVEDIADTVVALSLLPSMPTEAVVNVGSGRGVMLRDFVLSVARIFDGEGLMQFGELGYRETELFSLVANVTRLRGLLGNLQETPLTVGVDRVVASLYRDKSFQY